MGQQINEGNNGRLDKGKGTGASKKTRRRGGHERLMFAYLELLTKQMSAKSQKRIGAEVRR